jgi:hypothetical protein
MRRTLPTIALALISFATLANALDNFPHIVKRGRMLNQTAPQTITIFTTADSGLYRLSIYGSIVTADPTSQALWLITPSWNDDSGQENSQDMLNGFGNVAGSFYTYDGARGGAVFSVEAQKGTPIVLSIAQSGSDSSVYSVYYTVERLE